MSDDTNALADSIERIAERFHAGWHDGIKIDATDLMDLENAANELRTSRRKVAALKVALREECMFFKYGPWAKKGDVRDGCNRCIQNWPSGTAECHEPGCLAALQEGTTAAPTGEKA